MRDTIQALATAPGRAAIAVVRVSGPRTAEVLKALGAGPPAPRRLSLRRLRDPDSGALLDAAMAVYMPGPNSFTGEDAAELHLHGGRAVVQGVAAALSRLGVRLAEPGEFTRRAFEAGRLDLTEAEAVADLVDAETEAQRRQALAQLAGGLAAAQARWRDALLDALASLEAAVDFPDEDLPAEVEARAREPLETLRRELARAAADTRGDKVRDGLRVALIGAANAGKSSLFNALLEREAAIVTAEAGTTRDVLEAPLDLAGYRVWLADMAGLRETGHAIEAEGVRRARAWAEAADLRLWVVDASVSSGAWREAAELVRPDDLLVLNKADLPRGRDAEAAAALGLQKLSVSAVDPAPLRAALEAEAVARLGTGEPALATRERHRALLADAVAHLDRARESLREQSPELAAEDVRLAARALERLSGRIGPEAVLDRIFGRFCIGK